MKADLNGRPAREELVRERTDALLGRISDARVAVTAAADELASLTRELRVLLGEADGEHV